MMSRIRVAIVGAGIGAAHLEGYLANPDLFDVRIIADLDEARASQLLARCDASYSASLADVLAVEELDVIDICLPPRMHHDAILACLARGKHVVCEKPLVASLQEIDEVIKAAEHSNRLVMPVFQYRFGEGLGQLCALVEAGLAGKPLIATLETHWNRQADYYSVAWRGKWESELGGAIVGHAIHAHDLLSRVLGPIASVQASLSTRVNPIEVEDCAAIIFTMGNGALVTSSVTLGSAEDMSRLRFCFSDLTAESGLTPYDPAVTPWRFTARADDANRVRAQADIDACVAAYAPHQGGYARQFEHFYHALQGSAAIPVSLEDARVSLELITAIYASNQTGERVALPLPASHPGYDDWVSISEGE